MNIHVKRFFTSFIVLLIFAKVFYLLFEMYYNGNMLDTVTSLDVNKKSFENIESFGHNLTSFGMTVLIAPLFYWLVQKINIPKYSEHQITIQVIVFLGLSILSYSQIYFGLTKLMDYVVESQKEKRYESYYINTLKYGIISGKLGYGTFIPKRDNNEPLSIQEKVLLSNIFLLTHIDKTLIDRLITEGTEELIDVVISQYYNEEYQKTKKEFDDVMAELNSAWEQYQKAQLEINNAVTQKNKSAELEKAYMDMHKAIDSKYNEYKAGSSEYNSKITKANTNKNQIYNDLVRYFKYKGNSKAERQYEAEMKKQFGHYISPSAWCSGSVCPSRDAIDKTIKEEANKAFSSKSQGVPSGLSREGFVEHPNVKSKVIEELRSKGMLVNNSFDYSPAMFEQAYLSSLEKNRNEKITSLKSRLENQGATNIKMGMTREAFVVAFSDKINREISIPDNETKKRIIELFKKGDKTSFYDYAYRPYFKQVVASKYLLKQEDFDKPENKQLGDASIKMLYIPPFAVAMSLLAGGLNLVTLIALLITIKISNLKYKLVAKSSIILALMVIIIYMPYNKAINENLLSRHTVLKEAKFESPWGSYINALNWIIVAETYNYQHVYSGLKSIFVNKSKNQWESENEKNTK